MIEELIISLTRALVDANRNLAGIRESQEKLLAIAEEARKERTSLTAKMQEAFRRPLDLPPPPVEGK